MEELLSQATSLRDRFHEHVHFLSKPSHEIFSVQKLGIDDAPTIHFFPRSLPEMTQV